MDELQVAVSKAERSILYTINFETRVQHPFTIALELISVNSFNLRIYSREAGGQFTELPQAIYSVANAR